MQVTYQPLGDPLRIMMNERQYANAGHKDEYAFGGFEYGNCTEGTRWLHAYWRLENGLAIGCTNRHITIRQAEMSTRISATHFLRHHGD